MKISKNEKKLQKSIAIQGFHFSVHSVLIDENDKTLKRKHENGNFCSISFILAWHSRAYFFLQKIWMSGSEK